MPAWVASFVKVAVQAPIYGLVLAVPSSMTRFPSAAATASPPNARLASRDAKKPITKRMNSSCRKAENPKMLTSIGGPRQNLSLGETRARRASSGDVGVVIFQIPLGDFLAGRKPDILE